jgi:hypothetical protein
MPGLLRGVARTAVVAGTASSVSGRVQRRQAERFAERDAEIIAGRAEAYQAAVTASAPPPPQPPPAAAATGTGTGAGTGTDIIDQLERLGALRTQGILTEEEFAAQKARILGA